MRTRVPEIMDQPGLDVEVHRRALDGLGRIHVVSRSAAALWRKMRVVSMEAPKQTIRVLDLGCGGGQVAIALARLARAVGARIEICGCDSSPVAVDYARKAAVRAGVDGLEFRRLDVLAEPLPMGFDVAYCTLFLHHLSETDAIDLLGRMATAARRLLLVSDLRRTTVGRVFAWVGCRLLTRSPVVHVDGMRSVAAAFTSEEALALAVRAGWTGATIRDEWPQRFMLQWRRDGG